MKIVQPNADLGCLAKLLDSILQSEASLPESTATNHPDGGPGGRSLHDPLDEMDDVGVLEACLKHLGSISCAKDAAVQAPGGDVDPLPTALALASEDLVAVARTACQLAALRSTRRRDTGNCSTSLEATQTLESTVARLTAARKTLKDKEWELSASKQKLEHCEDERKSQDERIRNLETALQRATSNRLQDMDRSDSVFKVLEDVMSKAARGEEKTEDLKRRLSEAETALGEVRAVALREADHFSDLLKASEQRAKVLESRLVEAQEELAGARRTSDAAAATAASEVGQRLADLERRLAASEQRCEDLERQLATVRPEQAARPPAAAPTPAAAPEVLATGPPERLAQEVAAPAKHGPPGDLRSSLSNRGGYDTGATQRHPVRGKSPASLLAGLQSFSGLGIPASGKARLASPARLERDRRAEQTPARQGRRPSSGAIGAEAAPSMPMDLNALGNLLTGGGLVGKMR